jgi:hypothetical protein
VAGKPFNILPWTDAPYRFFKPGKKCRGVLTSFEVLLGGAKRRWKWRPTKQDFFLARTESALAYGTFQISRVRGELINCTSRSTIKNIR